jgi:hypothetical protein
MVITHILLFAYNSFLTLQSLVRGKIETMLSEDSIDRDPYVCVSFSNDQKKQLWLYTHFSENVVS